MQLPVPLAWVSLRASDSPPGLPLFIAALGNGLSLQDTGLTVTWFSLDSR